MGTIYILILAVLLFSGLLIFIKQARQINKLKLSENILSIADDAIISVNPEHNIIAFNKGAVKLFEYSQNEIIGKPLNQLIPSRFHHNHSEHIKEFSKCPFASKQMKERGEIYGIRKNGEEFPAEASISKYQDSSSTIFTVIIRDISFRKNIEQKLKKSISEKDVLLKEIHHRVKNNLQIISSLLRLQSRKLQDESAQIAINESEQRISSIALLHELLYQSQDLSNVNVHEYFEKLASHISRSTGISNKVDFEIDCEKIILGLDYIIPCGLIVNELVTNSLKHGINSTENAKISISLKHCSEKQLSLEVKDNGIGYPSDFDFFKSETLGVRLVKNLTQQLDGNLEHFNDSGANVRIIFQAGTN